MEEKIATFGILFIVLISVFVVVAHNSITGNLAQNAYFGNKIYGGAIKKIPRNPRLVSRAYEVEVHTQKAQQYLLDNKDKWDCTFGKEAETTEFPCFFNAELGKYCCVVNAPVSVSLI